MYVYESLIYGYSLDEIAEEGGFKAGPVRLFLRGIINKFVQAIRNVISKIKSKLQKKEYDDYEESDDNNFDQLERKPGVSRSDVAASNSTRNENQLLSRYIVLFGSFSTQVAVNFRSIVKSKVIPEELSNEYDKAKENLEDCTDVCNKLKSMKLSNNPENRKTILGLVDKLQHMESNFRDIAEWSEKSDFNYNDQGFNLVKSHCSKMVPLITTAIKQANDIAEMI